ncbi:hypothetical protein Bbelb_414550 [Branchiostoma belcheri]|nr:hypothetical protein Bbelb_414550 [Branchiostoma belcheri]
MPSRGFTFRRTTYAASWELGRPMCWASPNLKLSTVRSVTMCEGKMFHSPTVLGKKLARLRTRLRAPRVTELWNDSLTNPLLGYFGTCYLVVNGLRALASECRVEFSTGYPVVNGLRAMASECRVEFSAGKRVRSRDSALKFHFWQSFSTGKKSRSALEFLCGVSFHTGPPVPTPLSPRIHHWVHVASEEPVTSSLDLLAERLECLTGAREVVGSNPGPGPVGLLLSPPVSYTTKQLYSFDPHMLDTPKAHVESFKGSLQYQGPVLWNSLAADQRQLTATCVDQAHQVGQLAPSAPVTGGRDLLTC